MWIIITLWKKPKEVRPSHQSYLSAAEFPIEAICCISIVCHVAASMAKPLLPMAAAMTVALYSHHVLSLAHNVCVGSILYGVVNLQIARSSHGITSNSDILGAETFRHESQVLALGQVGRVLVVVGTLFVCLPVFNVDIAAVVSICSLGGLAISLLAEGICVNFIGSLMIYLTQPFVLGDWIQTEDGEVDGCVQSIGVYHTVVVRGDQRPFYIPNSRFMQIEIINASRMTNRRILMDLPVRIATSTESMPF